MAQLNAILKGQNSKGGGGGGTHYFGLPPRSSSGVLRILGMGLIHSPETSVRNYLYSLSSNPESAVLKNKPCDVASATCAEGDIKFVPFIVGLSTYIL